MCGIFGFSHTTDVTRAMTPYLAWEMEDRGHDSWGATNGTDIIRVMGPVTTSLHRYLPELAEWTRAIFHTRAASQGSVCLENQHPFVYHGGGEPGTPEWRRTVVGIHNGIVSNHSSLNSKYQRNFAVDTMHIFQHFADRLSTGEIQGYGNLAWYLTTPDHPEGVLHLCRFNNEALHIARLETGELVFASTAEPIRRAARMAGTSVKQFVTIEEEFVYYVKFEPTGVPTLFKSARKLPFGTRSSYSSTPVGVTGWPGGGHHRGSTSITPGRTSFLAGMCAILGCNKKVTGSRKVSLVCDDCWKDIYTPNTSSLTEVPFHV